MDITIFTPMRTALPLLVLLLLRPVCAQDPTLVPELLRALRTNVPDSVRAQILVKLCYNLTAAHPDSARFFGEQALVLAERIGHDRSIADAHNNLGWLAVSQGDLKTGEAELRHALQLFEEIGDPAFISVVRSNLGWLAEHKGDRVTTLKEFQHALKLSEAAKDTGNIAVLLYNIGTTYNRMNEYARARDFFGRSLALEHTLDRPDKEAICLMGIGNTYRSEGDQPQALKHYEMANVLFTRIGDPISMGLIAENTAGLYEADEPLKAMRYYRRALRYYTSAGSAIDQAYALQSIGRSQLQQQALTEADSSLNAGRALALGNGQNELVMDFERLLAQLASARGDSKTTLAHYERYMALKDSMQSASSDNELLRLRTEFETERAEKDNELLREKDLVSTQRLRTRNLQLYGSLGLVVLALFGVLLVWRNLQQKRKHSAILEGLNAELSEKQARIEEINALLRLKVLRTQMDPHFIHNCLNAIKSLSLAGEHERAEEYLDGFARLLRMVLEHSVRDRIGLEEELDFLRYYVKLEGLRMKGEFTWSIEADPGLLNEGAMIPSLLVQPFVENAIWHGLSSKNGPKDLTVRFAAMDHGVQCTIEDNGVGRTAREDGRRSLGLKLTGERLQLLTERMKSTGEFHIEDLRNEAGGPTGTRVVLRLTGTSA